MFEKIPLIAKNVAGVFAGDLSLYVAKTESACERWLRDPLSHPTLDAMSLAELADLPPAALRSCCRE